MKANETANLATLAKDANMGETVTDMSAFCTQYLDVFNTGIDDILSCYKGGVNTFWENKAENGQAVRIMTRTL